MSTSPRGSASPVPGAGPRHALTATEKQRVQLEKLLKNPEKPAFVPAPVKEKTIRPAREMMKNVQGSSAGAGSGEFHVYKASRRREYERLKIMEEQTQKEAIEAEFEAKKRQREEQAEAKTAKNRAKKQKQKARRQAKHNGEPASSGRGEGGSGPTDVPLKKRRLVNGQELVFKRPGEDGSDDDGDEEEEVGPMPSDSHPSSSTAFDLQSVPVVEARRIIIHEED